MTPRLALLAAATAPLYANLVTAEAPCAGGTFGHLTLENCQTIISYSLQDPIWGHVGAMSLSPGPPPVNQGDISIALGGWIDLHSSSVEQFVSSTISADFHTEAGWTLNYAKLWTTPHDDGGNGIGERVALTFTPGSSGTLSISKLIWTDALCCGSARGDISAGWITLTLEDPPLGAPEPLALLLVGSGLIVMGKVAKRG